MTEDIIRTEFDLACGDRYRQTPKGDSSPTMPKWQEFEKQRREERRKSKTQDSTSLNTTMPVSSDPTEEQATVIVTTPSPAAQLTPRQQAIVDALNQGHYPESFPEGQNHPTFISETAPWLLFECDNNPQTALLMAQQLNYVKNWKKEPMELENVIATVSQKPLLRKRPKKLAEVLEKAGIKDEQQPTNLLKAADPMADLPFFKWCDKIESFFDVFPCIREACIPHPRRLWPFILFAAAAMLGTCMSLCYYFFYDHVEQRMRLNYSILGVGDPASGKGVLGRLMILLLAPIFESDDIADQVTNEWKESTDAKGSNKDKEVRKKIYNRFFGPRASNGEFIRSMINNKVEVDGELMNYHCITVDSEKDNSLNMSKSGGWQNRDIMVLKALTNEYDSQHYSNKQSVSGRFRVYWSTVETCTPPTLRRLVNERNFMSGLDTRLATIPMGKPDYDMMPLVCKNDTTLAMNETLKQWAYRLDQRRGELPIWPLVEHVHKWCDDRRAIAEFNDDQADWLLIKRCPYYGINVSMPWIDMRHWQEREETGTYAIDNVDRELCDLVLDIQYRTQLHWYYDLHRKYYDDQLRDAAQYQPHRSRYADCFRQLPDEFTTEQFAQIFGFANNRSANKPLQRLQKEGAIKRAMRGKYKKLVSEI